MTPEKGIHEGSRVLAPLGGLLWPAAITYVSDYKTAVVKFDALENLYHFTGLALTETDNMRAN